MITRVRNKTAQDIAVLGLTANQTKVIFYNKTFWSKEKDIREALIADKIELLNDYNEVAVSASAAYIQGFTETPEFNEFCALFNFQWASLTEEDKEDLLEKIGQYVLQFIKAAFRRANLAGYTRANLLSALGNIPTLLKFGDIASASSAVSSITTDAFFTSNRKTRLRALLDSVELT